MNRLLLFNGLKPLCLNPKCCCNLKLSSNHKCCNEPEAFLLCACAALLLSPELDASLVLVQVDLYPSLYFLNNL